MDISELILQALHWSNNAVGKYARGGPGYAEESLVKLRELLNDQLDVEAGGATNEPPPPIEG